MNVLLVHQGDRGLGGGQVQMNRLLTGLRSAGVGARVACRAKTRDDSVAIPKRSRLESLLGKVTRRIGLNDVNYVSSFRLRDLDAFKRADVIDYHCLHSDFFSYLALPRLTTEKPAVFTFHDMWPITGHCHASLECQRWKTGCGKCPHLDTYPPVRRDATAWEWKLKRWAYRHSTFTVVTPSRWLYDLTQQSMLRDFPLRHIPHGIDPELYRPLEKELCRTMLGIPAGKKVLLFVVERLDRPLKGADLLIKALQRVPEVLRRECVLLLVGDSGSAMSRLVDMSTIDLGYVNNDRLKVIAFSAADVFLHPTRADNFPLVLLESLACGTPVVSFRLGGVPELVRSGVTGFLAEPEDPKGFADCIVKLLAEDELRTAMSGRCREVVLAEYTLDLQVERYVDLYRKLAV